MILCLVHTRPLPQLCPSSWPELFDSLYLHPPFILHSFALLLPPRPPDTSSLAYCNLDYDPASSSCLICPLKIRFFSAGTTKNQPYTCSRRVGRSSRFEKPQTLSSGGGGPSLLLRTPSWTHCHSSPDNNTMRQTSTSGLLQPHFQTPPCDRNCDLPYLAHVHWLQ